MSNFFSIPFRHLKPERPKDGEELAVNASHITVNCVCGHTYDIIVDHDKISASDLKLVDWFLSSEPPP